MAVKRTAKKTTARKSAKKTMKRTTTARKTPTKRAAPRRETAKKAAPKRKTAARKTTVTKAAPKKAATKTSAVRDAFRASDVTAFLSEYSDLSRKEVKSVLEGLEILANRHLRKGAVGQFTLPGLLKMVVKRVPARKARKGINPFTGEETMFKAKPARNVVKVRPLKKLKDMAA